MDVVKVLVYLGLLTVALACLGHRTRCAPLQKQTFESTVFYYSTHDLYYPVQNQTLALHVPTSLSARLGSTTLARGMLTGSLLGCTVLRGILMGRLVMVSPWPPWISHTDRGQLRKEHTGRVNSV